MTKPILVTSSAGGNQGRTGRHVSEMLLERGARVRAFVRQIDERSDRLKSRGAEIVVGDFLDARSVEQAVEDVSAIYFAYPVQDGLADATAAMAFAARKHGVSRLVNLVMYQSSIDAPTPRMRQNYLSEQVFEWAGVGPLHLRATVFYENVARLVAAGMPAHGAIRLPLGNESTILPLISAEDVSRIAVGLLTGPARAAGTAYPVIGSVISIKEIVGTFARVLNKDIHYEEITDEQWRTEVLARGWNAHAAEHLSSLWKSLRAASLSAEAARFAVTDTIEKIGGARPKPFEQFVRKQQSGLTAAPAAARGPGREARS
jgi:uncharacterized protein YbjT (DUF2867 family)